MTHEVADEFRVELEAAVAEFGVGPLNDEQTGKLVRHYALLRRWNQRVNLTRIVEPQEAARLHYAESLFGAKFAGDARSVLDIGSGAGFPAIPLAVALTETTFTALEANQKKALFLKEAKDELRLDNFEVAGARLEEFDWSDYDLLTSRALDGAESAVPSIIERMRSNQRLMLYCSFDLTRDLKTSRPFKIETHSIPLSRGRIIAMIRLE